MQWAGAGARGRHHSPRYQAGQSHGRPAGAAEDPRFRDCPRRGRQRDACECAADPSEHGDRDDGVYVARADRGRRGRSSQRHFRGRRRVLRAVRVWRGLCRRQHRRDRTQGAAGTTDAADLGGTRPRSGDRCHRPACVEKRSQQALSGRRHARAGPRASPFAVEPGCAWGGPAAADSAAAGLTRRLARSARGGSVSAGARGRPIRRARRGPAIRRRSARPRSVTRGRTCAARASGSPVTAGGDRPISPALQAGATHGDHHVGQPDGRVHGGGDGSQYRRGEGAGDDRISADGDRDAGGRARAGSLEAGPRLSGAATARAEKAGSRSGGAIRDPGCHRGTNRCGRGISGRCS